MAIVRASRYVSDMHRSACVLMSLVGLLSLGSLTDARAATYYIIQSGPEAWTVMDPQGIEAIPGGGTLRRAWAVRVQRNILTGNPPQPGYVRTLSEYDCDQSRSRWREFSAFSRSGAALMSKRNPNPEWGPATDSSDIHAAYKVVCLGEGGGAVVSAESVAKVVIGLMAAWDPPILPAAPLPTVGTSPSATTVKPLPKTPLPKVVAAKAPAAKPPVAKPAPPPKAKAP